MFSSRRKFLLNTILGSAGLMTARNGFARGSSGQAAGGPVVISTWDFGQAANLEAWKILEKKGRAVDAVEAGVQIPEADETNQSVGYGGNPDRDGRVTLDACIMDEFYNCGSVACLEHIMHPIAVARLVLEKTPHVMLAGEGALEFALANGFKKENLLTPKSEKDWKEWLKTSKYEPQMNIENRKYEKDKDTLPGSISNHDTIGMIAIDANNNVGGACTTSGLAYKMRGRIGDSPIIGAGLYVDNEVGGATSSGVGEEVIKIVGAHLIVELMRNGKTPAQACKIAVERIIRRSPQKAKNIQVGFLAINKKGEYGAYALQQGFTYSVKSKTVEKVFSSDHYY
ncbi:MAG: glycosylasparaginase [Chitinophagaceae bacterium]|nr:MAG: glycosylasparaginase [Chitinophagaceae bacterium]